MLHWLWVIVIALVVGALAKLIMPGKDHGGFIITILLGIGGALATTWIGRVVGLYTAGESAGFLMSVLGAILILGIYRLLMRRAPAS